MQFVSKNTTQFTWSSTKPNFFNHFSCYYQLCDTLGVGTGVDSKFHHNIVVHEKENKIPRKLNWEQLWCSLMFQKSFHVPTHHTYPNEAELFIHWYGSRICLPIQQHTETLLWFWSASVIQEVQVLVANSRVIWMNLLNVVRYIFISSLCTMFFHQETYCTQRRVFLFF